MRAFIPVFLALAGAANALIHAVDSSSEVSVDVYKKALAEGFTRAIFRGYQEACSQGGRVDPTFLPSYKNAQKAGYKDFDAYFFPCTGSGNKCKPYAKQIGELVDAIEGNQLAIRRIWIDIETDKVCNAFNWGAEGNIQEAKKLIAAVRGTKRDFGIYTSATQWENIFGSRTVELAKDVPLWFAKFDNVETLELKTPFGGWTKADAKQYTDKSASKKFDLNVFSA
uniref:GH25 muramidase n=1 Tax=Blackwellomyces cardinalis TaxID=224370 RepID=A0A7S6K8D4_9HYPO|nr:GH25 muramidase [Blackwellomyces cardinalis]